MTYSLEPLLKLQHSNFYNESGISNLDRDRFVPAFLTLPQNYECSRAKLAFIRFLSSFLHAGIRLYLRPREGKVGGLDASEVDAVYSHEAKTYQRKHHNTTAGQDTAWRRRAAWSVMASLRSRSGQEPVRVLDLCTGTGLTAREIHKMLNENSSLHGEVIGVDFNAAMLKQAAKQVVNQGNVIARFMRGDATDLVESVNEISKDGLTRFQDNHFHNITMMFGVGGIPNPYRAFQNVLRLLEPDGQFYMTDMHRPVQQQPGEWALFGLCWVQLPLFEAVIWQETTEPVVLGRLWAWRDPTLSFWQLPLVTYQSATGQYWGFEVIRFNVESERWWFSLPIMPVAQIEVRKIKIDEAEASKRSGIQAAYGLATH